MPRKRHNVGDLILCTPKEEKDISFVFGILKKYERQFYYVDWADGNHNDEPYTWSEIQLWKETLEKYVKGG